MALQASSSFPFITYTWTFDVFLSFRGEDTRHGFTGHLYKALGNRGIHTFIDDEELPRGDEITPSLASAIENSRIGIIVLSKNYASSSFCLDELAMIMECIKGNGRLVLPIFYYVDPSDVRHHRGTYGKALTMHEERFKDDKEKVQKWREALYKVANLSGEHFKLGNEYEYVFIEMIVKEISKKISRAPLYVADYPVGLESRVLKVNKLLNDGSNGGVSMVGIYGVGGIGKTTLARAVYNLIADQFEGFCFLENMRENSIKHGLAHLQEMLLSKILEERDINLASVNEGISKIKHRLRSKKVLLVVDDVDKLEQLRAIVGRPDWFGFDSRVIITTRDKHLLAAHGVKRKYEVENLNKEEALELLIWNAFKYEQVDPSYMGILNKVVSYASGLPLALEVIGSNLFGRSVEEWMSALDEYKKIPNKDIHRILKVSFDALEEYQQKIFLDIACYFKGNKLVEFENILHAHHDVNPKSSICVLVERSLIKINEYGFVTLHDLIQDMGREIVRQESPEKPAKRSRLWLPEDIMQVLEENTGTIEIEIIIPKAPIFEAVEWDGKAFKKMKNLKTLVIQNGNFYKGPKYLPNSLRVLEWWGYPSHYLPSDFHPRKLAILKLPDNCLTSLQLVKLLKKFVNMRVLNFSWNKWITQIPDVSSAPNLEELHFVGCENLIKIDESVGFLGKLRILDLCHCQKLKSLPSLMLPSLEELSLACCFGLESFPEILGKMEKLTELFLEETCIEELPYSICNLTGLQELYLVSSRNRIILLPSSIFMLRGLDRLAFGGYECLLLANQDEGVEQVSSLASSTATSLFCYACNIYDEFLQTFLPRFLNVQELNLSYSKFRILPACIKDCHFLRFLSLEGCYDLQEIRGIPPNIEYLHAIHCISLSRSSRRMLLNKKLHEEGGDKKGFILPRTRIPNWFERQISGPTISFWFRNKIPAMSFCFLWKEELLFKSSFILPPPLCPQMRLIINDNVQYRNFDEDAPNITDHLYIYDLKAYEDEELLEDKWNRAVITASAMYEGMVNLPDIQYGLHVIKESSSPDDIRFTDPLLQKEEHTPVEMRDSHDHHKQQQQTTLASLEPHEGQGTDSKQPALNGNLNWDSYWKRSSSTTTTVQDQAAAEKAPGESSHTPGSAETLDIQAPSPASLSGKASEEELHLKSSCTASSPLVYQYVGSRNVGIDTFCASLDACLRMLSHSHDELATTALSEEAREALRSVQYFISNDASVLLYPEWCGKMKASLDYLSKLSADDGISREMGKLISEASQMFSRWSKDYVEASMKIDSIISELHRADELEMCLEDSKEKFREVVALENEMLEEQFSATKANMSGGKSKREIAEEGKALKAQLDELRKNVPRWEHEHILAKKIQAKIKAEWSKLREKFNKMV